MKCEKCGSQKFWIEWNKRFGCFCQTSEVFLEVTGTSQIDSFREVKMTCSQCRNKIDISSKENNLFSIEYLYGLLKPALEITEEEKKTVKDLIGRKQNR